VNFGQHQGKLLPRIAIPPSFVRRTWAELEPLVELAAWSQGDIGLEVLPKEIGLVPELRY
jgi:hypothetical protein